MTPERGSMGGADALLWTIDRDPVLRSTIVAVLVLDSAPSQADVRRLFAALVEVIPRLRWRGARRRLGVGIPHWVDAEGFDLDQHLHRVAAPAPGALDTVLALAQAMAGTAFDRALPLWEAFVVEGLENGRGALVLKVHHAVTDGIGGLAALLAVADSRAAAGDERACGAPVGARAGRRPAWSVPWHGAATAIRVSLHPRETIGASLHTAATINRLLAPTPFARSPLVRRRGIIRRFAAFDVPMTELERTAERLGGTLNDVFVAAVLGGLERYHELHGHAVDHLRGLIPVSIRRDRDVAGTNRFVPVRFLLPAGIADPERRVRRVHEVLNKPVHDPALRVSDTVAAVLSRLPAPVATAAFGALLKGNDFVATNVPGPRATVRVAGARLERIYAFSPPAGAGVNVSLVSVGGQACLGVNVDTAAVPDDSMLFDCFRAAFDEMARFGLRAGAPSR